MAGDPIEGQVLVLAAAKASVRPERLPDLVDVAQADLGPALERYRREYECVHEADDYCAFLAEWGHWEAVGDRLGFDRREGSAVRRAHEEQLRRIGRREGREAEFDAALEVREPVIVATGSGSDVDTADSPDGDGP